MDFLKGKTAIITGAGRAVLSDGRCGSIGYGIATAYAKEGANLVITGRNVKKLEDAKEELECRIFSGIREILIEEQVAKENEMYFVYELLEALLCYEKTEEDYKKIKHGINHPLNSRHVGQVLYGKLKSDYKF